MTSSIYEIELFGTLLHGESDENEVEIALKLTPQYNHTIKPQIGVIEMKRVNATIVKKSRSQFFDITSKHRFYFKILYRL